MTTPYQLTGGEHGYFIALCLRLVSPSSKTQNEKLIRLNVMDREPDYSNCTLDELLDAAAHVNREKYAERAEHIDEEIARRHKEKGPVLETVSIGEPIVWRIKAIQRIYAGLAWLGGVAVFFALLGPSKEYTPIHAFEGAVVVCVYALTYYGLKGRRSWVIPLLLVMAAFTLMKGLLSILQPVNDISSFLDKILDSAYVLFAAYQLYLFTKKEVRRVFFSKGEIVV